jgi:Skp family chaperone for outer membrane proteins
MRKTLLFAGSFFLAIIALDAVEIPLDTITPVRIGFIDLQRVFDTYPEKSFAEGDLLREIEKRRRDLGRRQNEINTLRQQISADEAVLNQSRAGAPVQVPVNTVPEPVVEPLQAPSSSTTTVSRSSTTAIEPYPTEDPLAGLPGHDGGKIQESAATTLPGMKGASAPSKSSSLLDELASSPNPVVLTPDAKAALQKRVETNTRALARSTADFKNFRTNAVGDMKVLQTQKTYGVMSKIYAVLQTLARDENITVVLDKAYVLYGEETVDLSDKLISRLQQEAL